MEDMNVTAGGYDFAAAHAAMQRYVDGNILSAQGPNVVRGRLILRDPPACLVGGAERSPPLFRADARRRVERPGLVRCLGARWS